VTICDIAAILFPERDREGELTDLGEELADFTEFSLAEVTAAVDRFTYRGKAPGPDRIPSRV